MLALRWTEWGCRLVFAVSLVLEVNALQECGFLASEGFLGISLDATYIFLCCPSVRIDCNSTSVYCPRLHKSVACVRGRSKKNTNNK